jgi:hypothetical protein
MDDEQARTLAQRVESLLESLDGLDASSREAAMAAVQGLVELYGEGLERIVRHLAAADGLVDAVAADEVVANLLLVHGLHPFDVAERVRRGLQALGRTLSAQDASAELVEIDGGVARIVLREAGHGRGPSTSTLRRTVEEALARAAPDLDRIDVEHAVAPALLQIGIRPSVAALAGGAA